MRVDARPVDRRHLPALHVGDAAVRIEDEHVGLRSPPPNASIAAAPVSPDVAPTIVARAPRSRQRPVHQPAEPLHGEILERQRRPVEQFEQKQIVVELDQRRRGGMAEAAIGVLGHRAEFGRRSRSPPTKGADQRAAACA